MMGSTWRVAAEALLAYKMRALLSTIGVAIGSASIVLVVTAGLSGGRYVVAQIEGVGSNLVYAQHIGMRQRNSIGDELTLADLDSVRAQIPGVVEVAASRDLPMTVVSNGLERTVALIGVTEGFERIRRPIVLRGRYFDPDEIASGAKVCLVTPELAEDLFPGRDPTGIVARVGDLRLTIVGMFKERVSTFGASEIQRESVLVPFHLLRSFTGAEFVTVLYAQASSPRVVPAVTRDVGEVLRNRHRSGARYEVENLTGLLAAAERIARALTLTLVVVAVIALVVSGIGIMNVMLVTVTERTREIGIRKTSGATRRTILTQFLIEAGIISGIGALAGLVMAIALLVVVRSFLPEGLTLPISGWSIVAALIASSSVGIVFGYLPAKRAADLQPVDALRYE
jgi:putative ABC transport system permease protein